MSDERWRPEGSSEDASESETFGGPLFPDEPADRPASGDDTGERRLRFGPNDTGPLPHHLTMDLTVRRHIDDDVLRDPRSTTQSVAGG